jgi:hypothetical protein
MRELVLASLLAVTACTFTPDTKPYKPKGAADCPGQKACGYRCVEADDPAAGCAADTCQACPSGPAHSVPICNGVPACAFACADGYYPPTGDPRDGCQAVAAGDAANCGSPGHACGGGEACTDGLCPVADLHTGGGTAMRGLVVLSPTTYAWTTDPQVAGGVALRGTLHRVVDGAARADVTGLGHATWVRKSMDPIDAYEDYLVAVAGNDPDGYEESWVLNLQTEDAPRWYGGITGSHLVGLALQSGWVVYATAPDSPDGSGEVGWEEYDPVRFADSYWESGGDYGWDASVSGFGEGAGFLWLGSSAGVSRYGNLGRPQTGSWGYDLISGGGVYFEGMARAPRADRIAARPGPTPDDAVEIVFADLRDGSVWMGLTIGTSARPWRLVRGDGPRTQMDVVADDRAVIWSDYDRGEIWEFVSDSGAPPFLLARGKPWALALTPDRVYWTDTAAQAIRSVAR